MSKRQGSHRARRVRKEWTKGNRERVARVEADDHSVAIGQERMRPRAISIDDVGDIDELPRGRVVGAQSGVYDVRPDDGSELVACRIKRGASTDNDDSTLVVVGDFVRVQPLEGGRGLIHHVEERATWIGREGTGSSRGAQQVIVANLDRLLCVVSAERSAFRRTIVDRYIVGALLGKVEPVVIIHKIDTLDEEIAEAMREEMAIYPELGYRLLFTSAVTEEGFDELRELCRDKVSALVGQSGVGKSTIMNTVLGRDVREVGEVRQSDRRGRHTTIGSAMLELPGGGYLVDTPGLREFGIWDLEPEELDGYFVEFLDYLQSCKYLPCTHTHEPGCAVVAAVEEGAIDEGRYVSYLSIFDTLDAKKRERY